MHATISLNNEEFWLLPERALFWPRKNILFIADVHLGKTSHFRKNGIALNPQIPQRELEHLHALVAKINPRQVIFLGDLFHADHNPEWEMFLQWAAQIDGEVILVAGNHDQSLVNKGYGNAIKTLDDLVIDGFLFTHEPAEKPHKQYNIYGHIHPGYTLKGKGRQALKLPCFVFGKTSGILPAFGLTTGTVRQNKKAFQRYFVIAEGDVFEAPQTTKK